jgi:hypothetical protein
MKQLFPCGHRGKGKYCHRCAQAEKLRYKAVSGIAGVIAGDCFAEAERLLSSQPKAKFSINVKFKSQIGEDPVTQRMRQNYD